MRLLHTADWHLGHTLRDHSRRREQEHFLQWLVATAVERRVDALLIAGDVFDSANPSPAAWKLWFEFLGALKRALPSIQVVVIAGNHDSAARLEAPRELLDAFDVSVVGRIARDADGALQTDDLLVPLRDAEGDVGALCVAIPFLRAGDVLLAASAAEPATGQGLVIPRAAATDEIGEDESDPLIEGMRRLHADLFSAARARLEPGQAMVAMAHGYLVGGMISELSERKVLGGNQHALPVDLFPDDCAYVALGHLHRPQPVARRDHVRYCGSPIPLSMPERVHAHHVVFADLADGALEKVFSLRVPLLVAMQRIPERGELGPEQALAAVESLPARDAASEDDLRPLLEVAVRLAQPAPGIGEQIARVCADKEVRLARVEVVLSGAGTSEQAAVEPPCELAQLLPEQVFLRRYARDHDGEVPEELLRAFRELLEDVEHGEPA